jgi:hypothetical protein
MAERALTHKGHSIVISDDPDEMTVSIDGEPLRVFGAAGRYWTPHQAYRQFDSLDDLARAVAAITRKPDR